MRPLGRTKLGSVAAKVEGSSFKYASEGTDVPSNSKATEKVTDSSVGGGKRQRGTFTEDEKLLLTNMSDAVNNVANALRETGPDHVDATLYLAVMESPRFTEESLIVVYAYLLDNKAQGRGFVGMSDSHRALCIRTFLA